MSLPYNFSHFFIPVFYFSARFSSNVAFADDTMEGEDEEATVETDDGAAASEDDSDEDGGTGVTDQVGCNDKNSGVNDNKVNTLIRPCLYKVRHLLNISEEFNLTSNKVVTTHYTLFI